MPIQIPTLDDRNYDQLYKETASVIARYFPDYADIGPADPAMALDELFCYLFDMAAYQLNRITPDTRHNFASLLGIAPVYGRPPEESLQLALSKLSRTDRAITPGDIAAIVRQSSAACCSEPVERVFVRPGRPVRVYVLQKGAFKAVTARHREDLRRIYACLRGCSPIGTRFLVEHTPCLQVDVSAEVVKRRDSTINGDTLSKAIQTKIATFLSPLEGGDAGTGWEHGRAVTRGDLYGLIEGVPGVDHVKSLQIKAANDVAYSNADRLTPPEGGLIGPTSPSVTLR
ncbi:MAG: hypothetical protein GXX99_03450 [Clostridiales bacterium]|nr:hypothetical protein [Clostridiales bacterium]